MDAAWRWKVALIVVITLGCAWFLIPTYYSMAVLPPEKRNNIEALQEVLPAWAPPASYRLNLGLDLQGGIHMVMRVDTRTALEKRVERRAVQVENYLTDRKLNADAVPHPERLELVVRPQDAATLDAVEKELRAFEDFTVGKEDGAVVMKLNDTQISRFQEEAVDQAMLVIRRRIDKWGVAEADIRKQGTDSIMISLPGAEDPERAKELIGTTAQLEFRLVDDSQPQFFSNLAQQNPLPANISLTTADGFPSLESTNREALLAYIEGKAPEGRQILLECVAGPTPPAGQQAPECATYRTWLVDRTAAVTGDSLASADASVGQLNEPEVNLTFDAQGARDFEQLTRENTGRRMAIVLDDVVHSAPRINEPIPGGRARITMGRSGGKTFDQWLQEAQNLALVLKAGALPAPVTTGEIRQVGATLGPELVRKGSLATLLGLALILIFMAVYYKLAGVISNVALLLNGLIILAALSLFNATLTLPGIAGFLLTLGMAVDANVLINERIREELRNGKTARAAVDQGYDRAFWTIFDGNITTLFAGFILFFTGTGPIRGFATTLIIGLIASMFTAIVVTRVITTYFVHGRNAQKISI